MKRAALLACVGILLYAAIGATAQAQVDSFKIDRMDTFPFDDTNDQTGEKAVRDGISVNILSPENASTEDMDRFADEFPKGKLHGTISEKQRLLFAVKFYKRSAQSWAKIYEILYWHDHNGWVRLHATQP